jgi:peptidoglycan/xylan/chitin deacetylase (PgdA/CDA1 family)
MNYKARLKEIEARMPNKEGRKEKAVTRAQKELIEDMIKTRAVVEKVTNQKLKLCRMPHGIDGPWIHQAAQEAGFILVNWTYGNDWTHTPPHQINQLIISYQRAILPGAIILLHDGWPNSAKSLAIAEAVLKSAQEKGYEVVPVGELLGVE